MGRGLNAEGIIGAYYVMDYGSAKGDGVSPDDAALKAADAAAQTAGAGAVLLITNQHRVSANLTITSPTLYLAGGQLLPDAGVLVNHAGDVQGRVKSFAGSGAVVVTSGCPTRPEWWGGVGTASWLYLPDGWDATWQAAKAASATTQAWLTVIGDSVSQGGVSSDYTSKSFYALLRATLIGRLTQGGDYWKCTDSVNFTAGFTGTPPFVIASPNNWFAWGFGDEPFWNGGSTAPSGITFTTPYACTDIDIVYLDKNTGTWQYTVDGGSPVTVTNVGGGTMKRVQLTGLANTTHTVVCGTQSTNNVMSVDGMATYKSRTAGIGFGKLAFGGAQMLTHWADNGSQPADRIALLGTSTVPPAKPSLAIIELGINDLAQTFPKPEQFAYGIERMVASLRKGVTNCSVLILAPSNPDTVSSDVTSGYFTNSNYWGLYLRAMATMAKAHHCAFLNIHAKWGGKGVSLGFQAANQPHPNDAGHADIAAILEALL